MVEVTKLRAIRVKREKEFFELGAKRVKREKEFLLGFSNPIKIKHSQICISLFLVQLLYPLSI